MHLFLHSGLGRCGPLGGAAFAVLRLVAALAIIGVGVFMLQHASQPDKVAVAAGDRAIQPEHAHE